MQQIVAIINQSQRCQQFIKYECLYSWLSFDQPYSWWVSRDGGKMTYWGGAAPGSKSCACWTTKNCVDRKKCNCDARKQEWNEDSGYLKDKSTLPVSELKFGDTGAAGAKDAGYHTLGKLECWG